MNPTPAFRLGCGTPVAGYTLLRCLGRGWESTSYLATEPYSSTLRRLKFYRISDDWDRERMLRVPATFEALAATGAVPPYHHAGSWWRNGREEIPFLVFGYIDGKPLTSYLVRRRWGRAWRPEGAARALGAMAAKLAAVHALGRAVGDFEGGANVMVPASGGAVWCDLDVGTPEGPNLDMANDRDDFFSVLDRMLGVEPVSPLIKRIARALMPFRTRKRVNEQTLAAMTARLDELIEGPWDCCPHCGMLTRNKTGP